MKRILINLMFLSISYYCNGQVSLVPDKFRTEKDRSTGLLEKCDCPNQFINTDSVYSFFKSSPIIPKGYSFFVVEDEPIPYDIVRMEMEKQYMLFSIRYHYEDDYEPYRINRKDEIISSKIFQKLLSAAIDSTTRYTVPIKKWNCAELGEDWITKSNKQYYDNLLDKRMMQANKKKYESFMGIYEKANVPFQMNMSIPVFDEEYKYAFMVFRRDGESYANFALFERKEEGWKPILVSKCERTSRIDQDFGPCERLM